MTKVNNSNWRFLAVIVCAFVLSSFAFSPLANAKTIAKDDQANQYAQDFKFVFEKASKKVDGKYVLNERKIEKRFGAEAVPSIAALVKIVNGETLTDAD